jgi:hypothetical protein
MSEEKNPFKKISDLFLQNQNIFNQELHNLRASLRSVNKVITNLLTTLEEDPFEADLASLKGVDTYAMQIISQGRDLENSRDKIIESIKILENNNVRKLNS